MESILGCGNCHTPKSPEGEPIASRNLSGGGLTFSVPPFAGAATNITPDADTGILFIAYAGARQIRKVSGTRIRTKPFVAC